MKQRITYVVTNPESFTPEQLEVTSTGSQDVFSVKGVQAAKEHRFTFGLDELPSEVSTALQQWHELHIRWASKAPYTSTPPFTSRVSPGLHVFFTPLKSTSEDAFCTQLHSLIDPELKCSSNETSIKMPILSERFSMSASSQYYSFLTSIDSTFGRLRDLVCGAANEKCENSLLAMKSATYVDVDYDTLTRALVVNLGWSSAPDGKKSWSEDIRRSKKDGTVEIGVLNHEPNPDPEDIQFGGFLTVLGQDTSPKPTRFQTPTRHYPLLSTTPSTTQTPVLHPLTYTTTFSHPTGLHPTLTITFPSQHLEPPKPSCKLHTHLTLPSYLFIDKYQFTDPLFLASKNLVSLRSLAGATDLEAPDWVVKEWGSAALFEIAHPSASNSATATASGDWNISIPLHLRYLPAANTSHSRVPVPWPVVFWACRADEGAKMAANPFDRVHLGYEALFGPKTRFMHVQPAASGTEQGAKAGAELVEWIGVPVLDLRKTGWVEMGTVGTVVVAFLGLCWVLFGRGGRKVVEKGKKKQ